MKAIKRKEMVMKGRFRATPVVQSVVPFLLDGGAPSGIGFVPPSIGIDSKQVISL